jgi:hypothetical protein
MNARPASSRRVARPSANGRGAQHGATQAATQRPGRRLRDPGDMAPDARLAELGAILAFGFRRLQLRGKTLAEGGEPEAPSDQAVDGNGAAEVA